MPFATTADQDNGLDAVVTSWAARADTWRLHSAIPSGTTTELAADGGYAAVAYTGAEWSAASGAVKAATVDFGTSTDAYADTAPYWAIHDAAGEVIYWDELPTPVAVSAASTPVSVSPVLFFRSEFA